MIGKMGFELHHVEEAFTSEHWMVRVYRCGPGLRRWQQQQQPAAAAGWCLTAAGGRRVLPDHNRLPSHVSAARLARRKAKRVAAKELPGGSAAGKLDGDAVGPGELGAEGGHRGMLARSTVRHRQLWEGARTQTGGGGASSGASRGAAARAADRARISRSEQQYEY